MNESSVIISSIENTRKLVYPNIYFNFLKATAVLLVIIIAISMIKGIRNKKYTITSIIAIIMTIISYVSYNYILKNINAINGTEQLKCVFQIACSYIAMIVNGLLCIATIAFSVSKKRSKNKKHKEELEHE